MTRERELYPFSLLYLFMGDAETHSRLMTPNEKMAQAVQTAASLVSGRECWVGDKWVYAFEHIGHQDSVIDIYNSFVTAFSKGEPKRVLSFRARAIFDATSISKYQVFYSFPVMVLSEPGKKAGKSIQMPLEVVEALILTMQKAYGLGEGPGFLVPVLLHRSKVAQTIESYNAQNLIALLKTGKAGPDELPAPVDPYFKLSSQWPECFPVPIYGTEEARMVSHVSIPQKYKTAATLEALVRKGWTVATS